jgi:sulfopyruvate decarboxylase subunit beta
VPRTTTVRSREEFFAAFGVAKETDELSTIVAKVEAVGPSGYVTDLSLLENRYQFARYLRSIPAQAAPRA